MNVLLVEDENYTAQMLQDVIESDKDFIVVKTLDSIVDTVACLAKYSQNIDLIFLDIHLSDGHSFEIFRHIDISIPIIFCTAYDEYALQAIKNNGIDYIMKPFEDQEILASLQKFKQLASRFKKKLNFEIPGEISKVSAYQGSFLAQQKDKTIVVFAENIAMFAIEQDVVYLYTFDRKRYPVFKNMEYIESISDPRIFFRINRQMLINRNAVITIQPYFNRKVILELKVNPEENAIVSRLKVSLFKEWLERK
ncbi:MAG: DNA-binding response regulator [Chryseobacterium sp.]|uniref:LytR/AlgR family response regulator transcription factor n=1 Tax=Chryseobacterium sp. TaxID=1871047 RepID=UPI000DB070D8|nr:LytTR family DNA-binding domain-containing protein [Chryseobacterium sp.]MPS65706.1 response regulator transcription factor [Chryseobacterium sp.]PZU25745.1 MAG: DNA-binding response regulator [Chryseobacterium sp.]